MRLISPKKAAAWLLVALALAAACLGWHQIHSPHGAKLAALLRDLTADTPWYWRCATWSRRTWNCLPKQWQAKEHSAWTQREFRRGSAMRELIRMGTNAWPAVPTLLQDLDHKNLPVAWAAGVALAGMKADEHPDWPRLSQTLRGKRMPAQVFRCILNGPDEYSRSFDRAYRRFALLGLAASGPAVASVYPDVVAVVRDRNDTGLQALAVLALAKAETERKKSVPLLKGLLQNPEEWPEVRAAAAQALTGAVPEDPELRPLLRQALQDQRALVRLGAVRALWQLKASPEEVLPVLTRLLSHKLVSVRQGALEASSELGSAAQPSLPEIQKLTQDENETVRRSAAAAWRSVTAQLDDRLASGGRVPAVPGSSPAASARPFR